MHTIKSLREANGWSQVDLAVKLRVSVSTVYKWEADRAEPLLRQFKAIADLFEVAMDDIEIPGAPRRLPRVRRSRRNQPPTFPPVELPKSMQNEWARIIDEETSPRE